MATKKKLDKASDNPVYQKIKRETDRFQGNVQDIIDQYREFIVGGDPEDRTLRVYYASPGVESSVNETYARVYGRLLHDENMLPEAQLVDMMIKRGTWPADGDDRIEKLQERISNLQALIYINGNNGMTPTELKQKTDQYEEVEKELKNLRNKRLAFTSSSIEMRANEMKIKDQIWQCVKEKVGEDEWKPVWNSLEEIDNETNRVLLYRVMNECISFWQGVPTDFLEDLPEVPDGEEDTPSPKPRTKKSSKNQLSSGQTSD